MQALALKNTTINEVKNAQNSVTLVCARTCTNGHQKNWPSTAAVQEAWVKFATTPNQKSCLKATCVPTRHRRDEKNLIAGLNGLAGLLSGSANLANNMKIAKITSHVLLCDMPEELGYSQQYYTKRTAHLVRVETEQGIVGWGECFGPGNVAIANKSIVENVIAPRLWGMTRLIAT